MILQKLYDNKVIHPPKWLLSNTVYLCYMGSQAYGVSTDTSDFDTYGICIPLREELFRTNEIPGFGRQKQRFEQYQEAHCKDISSGKEYDITVYNITKFFTLAMENNPNIVDALFVPRECIFYTNTVGELIRENRKIFLHKGAYHKFKGYAFSQLHKLSTNKSTSSESRQELIVKYGYDIKFGYHLYRLADEIEQILTTGDLNLQRGRETMKAIRRGEWTEQQLRNWFSNQERYLEKLYQESKLPYGPDEEKIKQLLLTCLEIHYGSLDKFVKQTVDANKVIDEIEERLQLLRKI